MEEIKKGPWKAEEDEVLINHVKKHGPRDWSSIRSKGLLRRTGKSCRLRWVNKLRPNLKSGVKFSAEEERTVIDLQAQFGNKWARIATYLPGRTDNDVKNFWSSRQKRLARILQTPPPPPPPPPQQFKSNKNIIRQVTAPLAIEAPSSMEQESFSSRPHPYWSSSSSQPPPPPPPTTNILSLPEDLIDPPPPLLCFEQTLLQPNLNPSENDPLLHLPFPMIPSDPSLALDSNFLDVFGHEDSGGGGCDPFLLERWCCQNGGVKMEKTVTTPDSFMDDFPMDMFDHIEPLPSPSDW